eukprot:scaffold119868_cov37-Prasinocladus_malaysianus.AAC.1
MFPILHSACLPLPSTKAQPILDRRIGQLEAQAKYMAMMPLPLPLQSTGLKLYKMPAMSDDRRHLSLLQYCVRLSDQFNSGAASREQHFSQPCSLLEKRLNENAQR